jgi:hypothetical protein
MKTIPQTRQRLLNEFIGVSAAAEYDFTEESEDGEKNSSSNGNGQPGRRRLGNGDPMDGHGSGLGRSTSRPAQQHQLQIGPRVFNVVETEDGWKGKGKVKRESAGGTGSRSVSGSGSGQGGLSGVD